MARRVAWAMHTAAAVALSSDNQTATLSQSITDPATNTTRAVAIDACPGLAECPGATFSVVEADAFAPTAVRLHGVRKLLLSAPAATCRVIEVVLAGRADGGSGSGCAAPGSAPALTRVLGEWASDGPWR